MIFNESDFNKRWDIRALKDLGTFTRGKSRHRPRDDKKLFENGSIPLVQTGEIREANLYIWKHGATYNEIGLRQSKLWPAGTLCITIAANIAETALLGYPMCFPDSVVGFNANPEITSEVYLHYVFTFIRRTIQSATSGSIQDNINVDFLTALKFRIPTKAAQDKIAAALSALDAKIELNNRINVELEGMAKLLYDYWFVQYDFPISAAQAAAMGKPHLKGKPYRASGGKLTHNETLKREIPEGWDVCTVGEVLDKERRSKNVLSSEIADRGRIPVVDQGSAFICGFTDDEASVINETPKIVFGDHTRILKFINFPFARGADGTQILTSREKRLPQHLFFYQLSNIDLSSYGYARHFKFLKDQKVVLPHQEAATEFEQIAESIYARIKNNIFQTQALTALRDWLLPLLMNGQVSVA